MRVHFKCSSFLCILHILLLFEVYVCPGWLAMSCGTPPLELSACSAFAAIPSAKCGLDSHESRCVNHYLMSLACIPAVVLGLPCFKES